MTNESSITGDTTPDWANGVQFRRDDTRERWMIVAPERVLVPQGPGTDIARLIDGERSVDEIISELFELYDADRELITTETLAFLQQLADQKHLKL